MAAIYFSTCCQRAEQALFLLTVQKAFGHEGVRSEVWHRMNTAVQAEAGTRLYALG